MWPFGSPVSSSTRTHRPTDVAAQYRRLRQLSLRLHQRLVKRLSKAAIQEGARRLGMLSGDRIIFESESETAVLMDYCIYNVYQDGQNAIERYLHDCAAELDSDELSYLQAMQQATYTVLTVTALEPDVGCRVRNLFSDQSHLLADLSLAATAEPGLVLATRLLDFGDFVVTGGAALPIAVVEEDELAFLAGTLAVAIDDPDRDPAALIRGCLEKGASQDMSYAEPRTQPRRAKRSFVPPSAHLSQRKGLQARQAASKAAMHRRCRCGSGKMFKNCCGRNRKARRRLGLFLTKLRQRTAAPFSHCAGRPSSG